MFRLHTCVYNSRNATVSVQIESGHGIDGNLQCNGTEDDISQCSGFDHSSATCNDQEVVVIDCRKYLQLTSLGYCEL